MGKLKAMQPRVGSMPAKVAAAPKVALAFYLTPEWRALMASIFAMRGRWCEDCGVGGKRVRLYGDHIVELTDGGAALDPENVRIRCATCHGRKTAAARAARAGGGR